MLLNIFQNTYEYGKTFIKWVLLAFVIGVIGGAVGSLFHIAIDYVTEVRLHNSYLVYLLPLGGIVIAGVYSLFKKCGMLNTDRIIRSVQGG